uniref:Uncharacterized protein n=1 Tax=Anguilla anguilla TaxID=7936 RepID=A0A0E9PMF1_ANGAN
MDQMCKPKKKEKKKSKNLKPHLTTPR